MEDITGAIDNGKEVDVIYLDFDKVPHRRLLKKVQQYGIKGNVLLKVAQGISN